MLLAMTPGSLLEAARRAFTAMGVLNSVDTKQQIRPIEEQLLAVFKGKENVEGKIFFN